MSRRTPEPSPDGQTEPVLPPGEASTETDVERATTEPAIGGRYRLLRLLGAGACGTVYEAVADDDGARPVALKVLRQLAPALVYQLKNEFRALSNHRHRNLVFLHELVVEPDRACYFTMERVDGVPFVDFVDRGPRESRFERLRQALSELALGLSYLHAAGHVHRDLKPSNVLVEAGGRVVILDFGLVLTASGRPPEYGGFQGTPVYAAPEQVDGARTTPASDWYAVGVMMYEILAGCLPFPGADTLRRKAEGAPDSPALLTSEPLPGDLVALCLRLLEPEPALRATGADVCAALGVAAAHDPGRAPPQLVGRERELEALDRLLARAMAGACEVCVVRGDSGMGKTALVEEFLLRAVGRGGVRILTGRCQVQESVPYRAFDALVDGLAALLRGMPREDVARLVPADVEYLIQLFPILNRVPWRMRAPAQPVPADRGARGRAFAALREILCRLAASEPLVVFVDDLQWCDADSADLLRSLLTRPGPRGLLFVAAARADGQDGLLVEEILCAGRGSLPQNLTENVEPVTWLDVAPLDHSAVARLVGGEHGNGGAIADAVLSKTGGHPFFVSELVRFAASGPSLPELSLDDAILARTRELSAAARQGLSLLCLAGRAIPRSFLNRAVSGFDYGALRELCVSRFAREVVLHGDFQVEPYHDRIRVVVSRESEAADLRAALTRLSSHRGQLGDDYVDFLADAHLAEGSPSAALRVLEQAARRAEDALAFHRAAELFDRARRLAVTDAERGRLGALSADAGVLAGRALLAAARYEEAATFVDEDAAFELRRKAMTQYFVGGEPRRAKALLGDLSAKVGLDLGASVSPTRVRLESVLAAVPDLPRLRLTRRATARDARRLRLFWSACAPLSIVDQTLSTLLTVRALELAARTGDAVTYAHATALYAAGVKAAFGTQVRWAERVHQRAVSLVEEHGTAEDLSFLRLVHAGGQLMLGDPAGALRVAFPFARSSEPTTELGSVLRSLARATCVPALYWLGRVSTLAEVAQVWIDEARIDGSEKSMIAIRATAAHVHLRQDDVGRARRELGPSWSTDPWWSSWVSLYAGEPEAALASFLENRRAFFDGSAVFVGQRAGWYLALGGIWAELTAQGKDRGRGLTELARSVRYMKIPGYGLRGPALTHLEGTLAWLRGDRVGSLVTLAGAADSYEARGMRLHAASVRHALARIAPVTHGHLEGRAIATFEEESIARPDRWARMVSPGLYRT